MSERRFSLDRERLLDDLLAESSAHVNGVSLTSRLAPIPIEPSESLELSPPSSVPEQLCGDDDSSLGKRHTVARASALGIPSPVHKAFLCILAGHEHEAHLYFTRFRGALEGCWQYYCPDLGGGVGLAEVRAFLAYGGARHLTKLECARWRERLDFEAGLRWPIPLDVRLPQPCPDPALRVAGKMREFVGLRDRRFPINEPFPFAYEFAQAYCGLSGDRVRSGKDWLERAGVIYRAGESGRSLLWRLTAQDAVRASGMDRGNP